MTEISKRFEQLVSSAQKKLAENNSILPIKTKEGIMVGSVLIKSDGYMKNLYKDGELIYAKINLNDVAIRLANMLARDLGPLLCDKIYQADQDYGKWFEECRVLKQIYHNKLRNKDYDRADVVYAKYQESLIKTNLAKSNVLGLIDS